MPKHTRTLTHIYVMYVYMYIIHIGFLSEFSIGDYSTMDQADKHLVVSWSTRST